MRKHKEEHKEDHKDVAGDAGTVAAEGMQPAAQAGAAAETPTASAPSPEEALQSELDAQRDRFLRLQADFENFRRRTVRDREDSCRRANQDTMADLLPVLDHLDLAMEAAVKHGGDDGVVSGFRLVAEQLRSTLEKAGLTAIDAGNGAFDPVLHEAIAHLPSDAVPENSVIQQTRRGYRLGDFLLRPAQVVVSSGSPESANDAPDVDEAPLVAETQTGQSACDEG